MALEEAFGCEIPDEDAEKLTTVQAAIDYINAKQDNLLCGQTASDFQAALPKSELFN